jgi:hypothetical protein
MILFNLNVKIDKPHNRRQSKALLIKATELVGNVLRHLDTSSDDLLNRLPATQVHSKAYAPPPLDGRSPYPRGSRDLLDART